MDMEQTDDQPTVHKPCPASLADQRHQLQKQPLPDTVQGDGASPQSSATEPHSTRTVFPILLECRHVLNCINVVVAPLEKCVQDSANILHDQIECLDMIKKFREWWTPNWSCTIKYWDDIEHHYPFSDPLCTQPSHYDSSSGAKCTLKKTLEESRPTANSKSYLIDLRDALSKTCPYPEAKDMSDEYLMHYWPVVLDRIIRQMSIVNQHTEITLPDAILTFGLKWTQFGHILQLTWRQAIGTNGFHHPIEPICYYPTQLLSSKQIAQNTSNPTLPYTGVSDAAPETNEGDHMVSTTVNQLYTSQNMGGLGDGYAGGAPPVGNHGAVIGEPQAPDVAMVSKAAYDTLENDKMSLQHQVQYYCQEIERLRVVEENSQALTSQVKHLQAENVTLTSTNQKLENEMYQLQVQCAQQFSALESQHKTRLAAEKQKYGSYVQERDNHIKRLEYEKDKCTAEMKQLKIEKDGLLNSMSSLMNQQMSRDESDLENINVKNRPMKILDDYGLFVSQEWLDAKTAIDDWMEERQYEPDDSEICVQITRSMMECYEFAAKLYANTTGHFADVLHNPLLPCVVDRFTPRHGNPDEEGLDVDHTTVQHKPPQVDAALDKDFQLAMSKSLRASSDAVDFKAFAKKLTAQLCGHFMDIPTDDALLNNKDLLEFCERCLAMCWKMALQQPPMRFECLPEPGGPYDENKHELHFGSADPSKPNVVVHYYVHPAMCHGDRQMKKARVVLHAKPEEQPPSPAAQDEGIPTGGATDKPSTAAQDEGMPTGGATDLPTEPREDSDSEAESWSRLTEDGGSARVMAPAPCDMADSRGEPTLESTQHEMQYPADPAAPTDMDDVD